MRRPANSEDTTDEWKKARGPRSQKWEYMIASEFDSDTPISTGKNAPNLYEIHDIVGLMAEWNEEGNAIGSTFESDMHQKVKTGVRFYRVQNSGSP